MINKKFELAGHSSPIYGLCETETDKAIFSCSGDKMIARWNLEKQEAEQFSVKLPQTPYSIAYDKKLNLLCVGLMNGSLIVIDLNEKKEKRNIAFHEKGIFGICFTSDSSQMWLAGGEGKVSVWNTYDFSLLKYFELCDEKVRSIAFSDEKKLAVIASKDGMLTFIDKENLKIQNRFFAHKMGVNKVIFHPNKDWLITGGKDAFIKVWDLQSKKLLYDIPAHNYAVYDMVFNNDGSLMASASRDKTVKIWDAENFEMLQRIERLKMKGHKYSVNTMLWKDDILLSAGDDKLIMGWKLIS